MPGNRRYVRRSVPEELTRKTRRVTRAIEATQQKLKHQRNFVLVLRADADLHDRARLRARDGDLRQNRGRAALVDAELRMVHFDRDDDFGVVVDDRAGLLNGQQSTLSGDP